ncbi:hypothetical protein H072_8309 [Dactylellina haptotyla CBS 200.50]|uniref:Uncharacterized protein n=1 Tax=Dactylellina haptotyla (strain CBS 200.50) TaxID=1284197 RepID=S8A593_DACHA|nr:hypothetical protein H072_8309 [Dactylellina haptotyla CBS 200.50]
MEIALASLLSAAEAMISLREPEIWENVADVLQDACNAGFGPAVFTDATMDLDSNDSDDAFSNPKSEHTNGERPLLNDKALTVNTWHAGTAELPIVVDSESEADDRFYAAGSSISPLSLASDPSSPELSVFDTTPSSATSTASSDSFFPIVTKEVIDLTNDETLITLPAKSDAMDPDIIDVEQIHSMEPQYFDDDIQMLGLKSFPDTVDLRDFPSDSQPSEISTCVELMMQTEEANRLMFVATWKPVTQTSAITKLPTEILAIIFEYCLPWLSNSEAEETTLFQEKLQGGGPLIRVCQRWRYILLPRLIRSVTISECTFLTKSAHCNSCVTMAGRHLVSVPIVRSLFDGTATAEVTQLAEHIRTVTLTPTLCERRSINGEDSLESGFVFFLPRVETVIIPSNLVRNFMNGASAHGLALQQKTLPNIRIHNTVPALNSTARRRLAFSDFIDTEEFRSSWIVPEDIKRLEVDGDCLQMCTRMEMLLLEELTINRRSHGDKFIQPPALSTLITLFSRYNTDFSTLSKITIRWLPKSEPVFASTPSSQDSCTCVTLAGIPSLEHLDASAVCPLFFAKKTGKCAKSVAFEYNCVANRVRPTSPTKYHEFRTLITSATEMRGRLILDPIEPSRFSTTISLISTKARDKPSTIDASLTTFPAYSIDLSTKVVRVTEYSAKAATRYKLYINNLIDRSTKAIAGREDKRLLSEYAIAARAKSLIDRWDCKWIAPAGVRKQRTTVLRWSYDVDMDVFFAGAAAGEFMVQGRLKDRLLNAREAEERKVKKAEMERMKSVAPPKKRSRKRKQDIEEKVTQPDNQPALPVAKKHKPSLGLSISDLLAATQKIPGSENSLLPWA